MLSLFLLLLLSSSFSFYLPGVAPRDYQEGDQIDLKVNQLDSVKTQLPYDFYSLPFCRPEKIVMSSENLGEILSGDRIENSAYQLFMARDAYCQKLCAKSCSEKELSKMAEMIEEEYRVNWIVDSIPAATRQYLQDDNTGAVSEYYEKGFDLGFVDEKGAKFVNNHVRLIISYHKETANNKYRIVGFEVVPASIKHQTTVGDSGDETLTTCQPQENAETLTNGHPPQQVSGVKQDTIIWTYDVKWEQSDIKWASRWDVYLQMTDSQIHWFSIINSITIVLFLSGMVAMIMMRTLHRDLIRYNEIDLSEEAIQEETGWKLIHADVFRPPPYPSMFSVLVGTGCQVFAMTLFTLFFAALGFLSPANRGGLLSVLLLLYVFMGTLAGYNATRIYKMFQLPDWRSNTLITSLSFPGIIFSLFFILNLFVWGEKSSGAVPFSTLVALLVLWLGISVPLVFVGSYFAFKKPAFEPPVKVNEIPRVSLLEQTWYSKPSVSILVGGILPFGAVFIEIFFIMSSVWLHQFYYVFGFLFIVFIILIITCAEISIVMCYFQLCNEDYHWWWRSYLTSGSSALYLFLYSILYFFTRLNIIGFVPGLLFFGYMLLVSLMFFVLTGTIGYFACFHFVRKIYSSIKID